MAGWAGEGKGSGEHPGQALGESESSSQQGVGGRWDAPRWPGPKPGLEGAPKMTVSSSQGGAAELKLTDGVVVDG